MGGAVAYGAGMGSMQERLSDRVVTAEPLGSAGASGNKVERVTLDDGTELIRKKVSPEWDWISRATGDDGRALSMWNGGLFGRIPTAIDHATVAVEADDDGWTIFMHDVSGALVGDDEVLDRASVRRILAALAGLHHEFWGERVSGLCSLQDRYHLLSPRTAQRENERGHPVGDIISRCWEVWAEFVPDDIAKAILTLANHPGLLAEQLDRCEQTLIHGDVRFSNLGVPDDRVVLIDWGERTGPAPAAVELASFLMFDATRMDVSRDDVIGDFRGLYGDRFDEKALQLALIGGMVQLGPNPVLDLVLKGGDAERAAAMSQLSWWTARVATALETWSPV